MLTTCVLSPGDFQHLPGPLKLAEDPIASVTIEKYADGTYSAHSPWPNGMAMGLSRGDLDRTLDFAREQLTKE